MGVEPGACDRLRLLSSPQAVGCPFSLCKIFLIGNQISGLEPGRVQMRHVNPHSGFLQGPELAVCSRNSVSCLRRCQPKSTRGRIRLPVPEANLLLHHPGCSVSNLVFHEHLRYIYLHKTLRFLSHPLLASPSPSSSSLTMVDWNSPAEIATDYGAYLATTPSVPRH